jgi:hypothetical protein
MSLLHSARYLNLVLLTPLTVLGLCIYYTATRDKLRLVCRLSLLQSARYFNLVFLTPPGRTGAHTDTIDATWKHVKVILNAYNRQTNYIYCLAEYMFASLCRARNIYRFTMFLTRRQRCRLVAPACARSPAPSLHRALK